MSFKGYCVHNSTKSKAALAGVESYHIQKILIRKGNSRTDALCHILLFMLICSLLLNIVFQGRKKQRKMLESHFHLQICAMKPIKH